MGVLEFELNQESGDFRETFYEPGISFRLFADTTTLLELKPQSRRLQSPRRAQRSEWSSTHSPRLGALECKMGSCASGNHPLRCRNLLRELIQLLSAQLSTSLLTVERDVEQGRGRPEKEIVHGTLLKAVLGKDPHAVLQVEGEILHGEGKVVEDAVLLAHIQFELVSPAQDLR